MAIGIVSDEELARELCELDGGTPPVSNSDTSPPREVATHDPSIPSIPSIEKEEVKEGQICQTVPRGRKSGDVNVPDSLRQIIASTALMDGRASALSLAKDFGISPSSVSAYSRGATSTTSYHEPKSSILSHINATKERAIKRASKTLNGALKAITQEKLDYTDADKLAGIAKDMSAIIKNLEPSTQSNESSDSSKGVQFTIFAPQFRDERTFEHIVVNE